LADIELPALSDEWLNETLHALPDAYRKTYLAWRRRAVDRNRWIQTLEALIAPPDQAPPPGWQFPQWLLAELVTDADLPADLKERAARTVVSTFSKVVDQVQKELRERVWDPLHDALAGVRHVALLLPGRLAVLPVASTAPEHLDVVLVPSLHQWLESHNGKTAHHDNLKGQKFLVVQPPSTTLALPILERSAASHHATTAGMSVSAMFSEKDFSDGESGMTPASAVSTVLKNMNDVHTLFFTGHSFFDWIRPWRSGLLCMEPPPMRASIPTPSSPQKPSGTQALSRTAASLSSPPAAQASPTPPQAATSS
jgi:hypothetical protein